jgi:hypothetical protein
LVITHLSLIPSAFGEKAFFIFITPSPLLPITTPGLEVFISTFIAFEFLSPRKNQSKADIFNQ